MKHEMTVDHNDGGFFVEFFNPETEKVAHWYGSRQECHQIVANGKLPSGLRWYPIDSSTRSQYERDCWGAAAGYDN